MMSGDIAGGDEEFMEKILKINYKDVSYNEDTFTLFGILAGTHVDETIKFRIKTHNQTRDPVPLLEGRDLESIGVKHYKFSQLSQFVNQNNRVGGVPDGSLYMGVVDYDGPKTVTIKVWSFDYFPLSTDYRFHPARVYNDIYLLKKKLSSKSYLPKLIGYSIDKMFAVVYDIPAKYSLGRALSTDFSWEDRLLAALDVARALQLFHDQNLKVGHINPRLLIYDKDMNLYWCNFGLCPDVKDKIQDEDESMKCGLFDCGVYKYGAPELANKEEWSLETDIYAYGVFLLVLISRVRVRAYDSLPPWAETAEDCHTLLRNTCKGIDEATITGVSKLVMECTNNDMYQRPKVASVIHTLERMTTADNSSPLRKKQKLEQEADGNDV